MCTNEPVQTCQTGLASQECANVSVEKCDPVLREVCEEIQLTPTEVPEVAEPVCKPVCRLETRQVCQQVPKEQCSTVQREICKEEATGEEETCEKICSKNYSCRVCS